MTPAEWYKVFANADDPTPARCVQWPRWLKAGDLAGVWLNNACAKVRLGRI